MRDFRSIFVGFINDICVTFRVVELRPKQKKGIVDKLLINEFMYAHEKTLLLELNCN